MRKKQITVYRIAIGINTMQRRRRRRSERYRYQYYYEPATTTTTTTKKKKKKRKESAINVDEEIKTSQATNGEQDEGDDEFDTMVFNN